MQQIGQWLEVNGEAIYGSRPWTYQNDTLTPNVWLELNYFIFKLTFFRSKNKQRHYSYRKFAFSFSGRYTSSKVKKSVYAVVLFWPERMVLDLGAPLVGSQTKITFLGYGLEEIEVSPILFKFYTFHANHMIYRFYSGLYHRQGFKSHFLQNQTFLLILHGLFVWIIYLINC